MALLGSSVGRAQKRPWVPMTAVGVGGVQCQLRAARTCFVGDRDSRGGVGTRCF